MGIRRKWRRDKKAAAFIFAAVAASSMLVVMIFFIAHVALKVRQSRSASQETATITTTSTGLDQRARTAFAVRYVALICLAVLSVLETARNLQFRDLFPPLPKNQGQINVWHVV